MSLKTIAIAGLISVASISASHATTVGFFSTSTSATLYTNVEQSINTAGASYLKLGGLDASSLAGIDVLWVSNRSNTTALPAIGDNYASIESFVQNGGVLFFQSRLVTDATSLPGASGISLIRDLASNNADVNVLNHTTTVTHGPAGMIDDATLDGGNSSSHGYAVLSSLPNTAISILSRPDPTQVVDFTYQYGNGDIYFSSIPSDYFLGGTATPLGIKNIYAPNVVAFTSELAVSNVPLPSAIWFLGTGILGLLGLNKKKQA